MAAAAEEDVSALGERIDGLSVSATEDSGTADGNDVDVMARSCEPRLWGFETRELYKLALNFYKGKREPTATLSPSMRRGIYIVNLIKLLRQRSFVFLRTNISHVYVYSYLSIVKLITGGDD